MSRGSRPLTHRYGVVAGERSGDQLGAALVRHMPGAFAGLTGPALEQAGCRSLGSVDELSLVGLTEVVPELPRLVRRLGSLESALAVWGPRAVVTIDSPSFNLRLARRLRRAGLPVVHWVAPQVWAWRPGRARRIAASVDALACLFPFEPALFGSKARFVGHPAAAAPLSSRPAAIGVAAGSRTSERERLGPVLDAAATAIGLPVVEAVPPGQRPVCPYATHVDSAAAMAQNVQVALVGAGTATLELAVAGVPMVVAYQTSALTYGVLKHLVRVDAIALPNLILGRRLVPEVIQDLSQSALIGHVERLLGPEGDTIAGQLREVRHLLSPGTAIEGVAQLCQAASTSSHFAASTKSL